MVVDLARNPIVAAIVLGGLYGLSGLGFHPIVDKTITLLGQAGVPAALMGLGLSLSAFGFKGNIRGVTAMRRARPKHGYACQMGPISPFLTVLAFGTGHAISRA